MAARRAARKAARGMSALSGGENGGARRQARAPSWMGSNLKKQGYCLSENEQHELRIALRFSTGLCLSLVLVALVLESAPMVFALCAIGVLAGFTSRHPFDHLWNRAVRHLAGGPPLPANPARRRHAFKLATVWLACVGALLAVGETTLALVLGGLLVGACAAVTALNLCLPSEALALWEHLRCDRPQAIATSRGTRA
jgi:hypothetical protein